MNTQLAEQPKEQVLPMHEALALVQAAFEADIEQNNLMVDELERFGNENTFLKLQVQNLTARVNGVTDENEQLLAARKRDEAKEKDFNKKAEMDQANAEQHIQMLSQAQRQEQQAKTKLNDALLTIASYKEIGSPKKIREKIKNYKASITKLQAADTQYRIEAKKYRHDVAVAKKDVADITTRLREVDITEIYSENGENLYLFPKVMQIPSRGMTNKKIVMLYLNDDGRGGLMSLDDDSEITLGKGTIRPKVATKNHCATFLRKWNKAGHVQADDLRILGEQL